MMIFSSRRATTDFRNIFLLIELCLCIPVGNAEPEQLFSRLKRIKTDNRWDKVFKSGLSKSCGRQPIKNFTWSILEYFALDVSRFYNTGEFCED